MDRITELKKSTANLSHFDSSGRGVIWNWEESPSNKKEETRRFVRYHVLVIDDRFIDEKIEKLQQNFLDASIVTYPFNEVKRVYGKSKKAGLPFLFVSFDTDYTTDFVSFKGISNNVKKDKDLREREVLSIEDYIQRKYLDD